MCMSTDPTHTNRRVCSRSCTGFEFRFFFKVKLSYRHPNLFRCPSHRFSEVTAMTYCKPTHPHLKKKIIIMAVVYFTTSEAVHVCACVRVYIQIQKLFQILCLDLYHVWVIVGIGVSIKRWSLTGETINDAENSWPCSGPWQKHIVVCTRRIYTHSPHSTTTLFRFLYFILRVHTLNVVWEI